MVGKVNFYVKKGSETYHISMLGVDPNRYDIYYHFLFNHKGKTIYNEKGNKVDINLIPDHISFHHDGTVHYRYKKNQVRQKDILIKKDCSIFETNLQGYKVYPFLIHSFYSESLDDISRKEEMKDEIGNFIWDITGLNYFSLICLSIVPNVNVPYLLETLGFYKEFNIHPNRICFTLENNNYNIVICLGAVKINSTTNRFSNNPMITWELFPNLNNKNLYEKHPNFA